MLEFEIEGTDSLLRLGQDAEEAVRTTFRAWLYRVEGEARRAAPVDTGTIRNRMFSRLTEKPDGLEGHVGTAAHYARYVHEGTRPHYVPLFVRGPGGTLRPTGIMQWIRRRGLEHKLAVRKGLWFRRGDRKWFVPFDVAPRLKQWAEERGLQYREAVKVSGRARPFIREPAVKLWPRLQRDILAAVSARGGAGA